MKRDPVSIEEKIKQTVREQLGEEEIMLSSSFVDDLGADSLDCVELVMAIEEHFEIEIPDDDAEKFATVKDVVEYVKGKVGGGQ